MSPARCVARAVFVCAILSMAVHARAEPDDASAAASRAVQGFVRSRDADKAREAVWRSIKSDPGFTRGYLLLGVISEMAGDWEASLDGYRRFLEVAQLRGDDRKHIESKVAALRRVVDGEVTGDAYRDRVYTRALTRARIEQSAGDSERALAAAHGASLVDPQRHEAYSVAAAALAGGARYEEAAACLEKAVARSEGATRDRLRIARGHLISMARQLDRGALGRTRLAAVTRAMVSAGREGLFEVVAPVGGLEGDGSEPVRRLRVDGEGRVHAATADAVWRLTPQRARLGRVPGLRDFDVRGDTVYAVNEEGLHRVRDGKVERVLRCRHRDLRLVCGDTVVFLVAQTGESRWSVFGYRDGRGYQEVLRLPRRPNALCAAADRLYFALGPVVHSVLPGHPVRMEASLLGFRTIPELAVHPDGRPIYVTDGKAVYAADTVGDEARLTLLLAHSGGWLDVAPHGDVFALTAPPLQSVVRIPNPVAVLRPQGDPQLVERAPKRRPERNK